MPEGSGTARTRIRRNAKRAEYGIDAIRAVLDANQICHVAYVVDGEPRIIPTLYMRLGDYLYLHGNRQAAVLRHLAGGGLAAVSVTTVDGIVVARSVVLFGNGEAVAAAEHETILDGFVEKLIPGHHRAVRPATSQELAATATVRIPIKEASAKVRSGPANDDEPDLDSDVWAGVIPLLTIAGQPEPNPDLKSAVEVPDYIEGYRPPA